MGVVYLIHFDRPYRHARHYMGYTSEAGLDKRLDAHARGNGARLMQVITDAGITWRLARVWENATRRDERRRKGRGLKPLCPICRKEQT